MLYNVGLKKLKEIKPTILSTYEYICINCKEQKTSNYRLRQNGKDARKFCGQKCRKAFLIELNLSNPKTCVRCKIAKTKKDFKRLTSGQSYKRCIECELEIAQNEPLLTRLKEQNISYSTYHKGLSPENFIKDLVRLARSRAKEKGRDFNIDVEYVMDIYNKQNGICPISGIKMTHIVFKGHKSENISIDRINSKLGYIKGNIQLLCYKVNIMKLTENNDNFIELCGIIYKYAKSNKTNNRKV